MQDFASAALPVLAQLMRRLQAEGGQTDHLAVFQRTAVKIFWSCIFLSIPNCLIQDAALAKEWLQVRASSPRISSMHRAACRQPERPRGCRCSWR